VTYKQTIFYGQTLTLYFSYRKVLNKEGLQMPAAFNIRDKWPHCLYLINTVTFPWPRVLATDLIN